MGSSVEIMYWFYLVGLLLAVGMGAYAAYWSLGIGRALKVRTYSRQAIIVGLFSLYGTFLYVLFYIVYFFAPNLLNSPVGTFQEALYLVLPPFVLAWIDSGVRVGRKTDPLLRDPLRWSKVRFVVWPLLLLSLIGFYHQGGLNGAGIFSFLIIGISIVPILMAANRSGDRNYRRSLEWFGFAVAILVFQNFGFNVLVPELGTGIVFSSSGFVWSFLANFVVVPVLFYGIYKCARSLVPLNRISV